MDKKFCELCGTKLVEKEKSAIWRCESCEMHQYASPKPANEIVLYRGGKILISERGINPNKGMFDMPGGFVELYENFETALEREVEEELAISKDEHEEPVYLRSYNIDYPYGKTVYRVVVNVYIAELSDKAEPVALDDVASLRWISQSDIDDVQWSSEHQRKNAEIAFARIAA